MTCPKCGSENVNVQREQTATIGGSTHKVQQKKAKGCLYWCGPGLIISTFKFIFHVCTLGFFRKRKNTIATGKTVSVGKTFNRTVAVCQNCGKSWKV